MTGITIALLAMYERSGWIHPSIIGFMEQMRLQSATGHLDFRYRVCPVIGNSTAAYKRNMVCRSFRDGRVDAWGEWLCMVDNDMQLPENLFDCLKGAPEDASIIVPRMYFWDLDHGTTTLCWGISTEPTAEMFKRIYLNTKGFTRLVKCGSGAVFIHRRVFSKIQEPYFFRNVDPITGGDRDTEDIYFSTKVREAGLKIYGCNSVEVGHWHNVDLSVISKALYAPLFAGESRVLTTGMRFEEDSIDESQKESNLTAESPSKVNGAAVESQPVSC